PGPVVKLAIAGTHVWPWTRRSLVPIYGESRVDPELIQEGQENLANHFASNGYFNAVVTATVTSTSANGQASERSSSISAATAGLPAAPPPPPAAPPVSQTITYTVQKGPRHDVEQIAFAGNQFFSREDLLPQVALQPEGLFSHGSFSQQLLRASVDNITSLYQASGYSSVQVTPAVTQPGGNLAVKFQIVEGPQDFVSELRFQGNTLDPALLAPQGLMLGPGTPYAQNLINEDRARVLAYYLAHGYLNATFRATAERQPSQPHQVAVVYQINEGPRVRTAAILTAGRQKTRQRLIDLQTNNLKPDTSLTATDMLTAESRLYAPGIFDWAEVGPRRPITSQSEADVVVKVHEARPNALVYGFGFDLTNRGGSIPSGTVALPGLP
ncbi:MAG: POTRA domain-containing protein, partial [Terriglobales bacterium]